MATLLSAYNASYSENASILTGNPNRVTVEVEDVEDECFWRDLLVSLRPEKDFHFDPYKTLTPAHQNDKRGKGKAEILLSADSFNAFHIGCVDSDYDWLLSDITEAGKRMTNNKFLLQTYGYSIENLLCLSSTLQDFCHDVTEEDSNFDFCNYLSRLSQTVYPLLLWSVYLYGQGKQDFTPQTWRNVLINTLHEPESSLAEIVQKVKKKLQEIEQTHPTEVAAKEVRAEMLQQKGVTPETAYLYVRGHELFEHLLNSILRPLLKELGDIHFGKLNKEERNKYLSRVKQNSPEKALYRNYRYKQNSALYDRIAQDVAQIW